MFMWVVRISPRLRRLFFHSLFEFIAARVRDADRWVYMNYGVVDATIDSFSEGLSPVDLENIYPAYLYHRVASGAPLRGAEVLEIGCGRGGGASFVTRTHAPKRMAGIDISRRQIEHCRRVHSSVANLSFFQGDAEAIPFPDSSFDAVINVESAFCYGSMDGFLAEVRRVLRAGGYFLYADLRLEHEVVAWDRALAGCGMTLLRDEIVTNQVVAALKLDTPRRIAARMGRVPRIFEGLFDVFSGVEGTRIPNLLASGEMIYRLMTLQKPLV